MSRTELLSVAAAAVIGFVASLLLTRLMIRLAIMDEPNHRSSHSVATPRSGGVAIIAGFLVAVAGFAVAVPGLVVPGRLVIAFLAAAALLSAVALIDDVRGLRARVKFAAQLIAGIVLVAGGFGIERITLPIVGPIDPGPFGSLLAVAWILYLTNAYNFMDGINGIAAGTAIVGAAGLAAIAHGTGNAFVLLSSVATIAGAAGFLVYNFPRGRIFMGDVGSQFLGLLFGALTLIGRAGEGASGLISVFVVPMLFAAFAFDVAFTLVRRALAGERLSEAHRGHLYQLCTRMGYSHVQVTALYLGFGIVQAAVAYWAQFALEPNEIVIGLLPLLALNALYAFVVVRAARRRGLLAKAG